MTVAVVGYASIDRSIGLDRFPQPGITSRVTMFQGGATARPGGIFHTVVALIDSGLGGVTPICGVGQDALGEVFLEALREAGCDTGGIDRSGIRTPSTDLLYGPDGETSCIFDPGTTGDSLNSGQRQLIELCDLLVLMIGPPGVIRGALEAVSEGTAVAWIVKNDPTSLGAGLAAEVGGRANIVFHNAAETAAVLSAIGEPDPIVVRTDGPHPITVTSGGSNRQFHVEAVEPSVNPTGAGDAFAGGYIASWRLGMDEASCVAGGVAAAAKPLGVTSSAPGI